jgi:hypothetical protein
MNPDASTLLDQRGAGHSVGCAATCHRRRGEHARFRRYLLGLRDRERGQLPYRSFRRTAVDADRRTSREIAQCGLTRANISSLEDGDAKPKHLATKCDFPGISYAAWLYANRLTKRSGRKDRRFARLSGLNFMCRALAAIARRRPLCAATN